MSSVFLWDLPSALFSQYLPCLRFIRDMRIDKFFTSCGLLSRTECAKAAKEGRIRVNGVTVKRADTHIDELNDTVELDRIPVEYKKYYYIMMNKPSGYVSSTDEPGQTPVTELLDERLVRLGLFPCGRLDKDTVGLLILTNDGESTHNALSPKKHVEKIYEFECAEKITERELEYLRAGATLADGYTTLPCEVELFSETKGKITLHEGKYHQIKRMFASCGNKITYLKRISFGKITLDPSLDEGQWRYLTPKEEELFVKNGHN